MIEAKRRTLDEAARSYGTDKGGQYHGYAAQYERVLEPIRDFRALEDRIENTVDYFALTEFVKAFSLARPRRLIETLAEEIATELLARFALSAVEIELRKFILPDTQFVAVRIRRERA